jgi:hypothetical protein
MSEQAPLAIREASFTRAHATATVQHMPSALMRPVSGAMGRMSEILNSTVICPKP